jgi:hypothetical protein
VVGLRTIVSAGGYHGNQAPKPLCSASYRVDDIPPAARHFGLSLRFVPLLHIIHDVLVQSEAVVYFLDVLFVLPFFSQQFYSIITALSYSALDAVASLCLLSAASTDQPPNSSWSAPNTLR